MITKAPPRPSSQVQAGYLLALAAALAYGSSQTLARKVTTELAPPLVATAFALLFGLLYVSVLFHRPVLQDLRSLPRGVAWFGLSGLASAWGVTFLYFAMSHAPVVVVAPTVAANPLVTLVLARLFLRHIERITPRVVLGVLLVVAGVVLVALG